MGIAMALIVFALGVFGWTLVEYAIHGLLSHRFRTFATPLHQAHHRDPHAVFTIGAWLPLAIITLAMLALLGSGLWTVLWLGLMMGFALYEAEHYRIHFCEPRTAIEARLRARHLAHHRRVPNAWFGVTSQLWDRVFASEPPASVRPELEAFASAVKPLSGPTNIRLAIRPWVFLR